MRKLFFVLIVGLCLAACSSPFGIYEDLAKIPGVMPGEGDNNYNENTTYKGALLPWSARGREDMVDMLKLIGTQKGEIDDALFIESLNNKLFDPVLRYTCRKNYDGSPAEWEDQREMLGGPAFFTLCIIAKTKCNKSQNQTRFFEPKSRSKRNVTKIWRTHINQSKAKESSNGVQIPFEDSAFVPKSSLYAAFCSV